MGLAKNAIIFPSSNDKTSHPRKQQKTNSPSDAFNIFKPIKYLILLKKETGFLKSRVYFYHRFNGADGTGR
jgi:hypothetical protein